MSLIMWTTGIVVGIVIGQMGVGIIVGIGIGFACAILFADVSRDEET